MAKRIDAYLRLEKGLVDGYSVHGEIPLNMDVILIGRPSKVGTHDVGICDIKVNDDYVSRGHVSILYSHDQNSFIIQERDGGTTNGTFINEEPINPGQPLQLQDGDLIQLARIGGNTTNFLNFDSLQKFTSEIDNDPELIELMDKVLDLNQEWRKLENEYAAKGRILCDLAAARIKKVTGIKYI